MMQSQLLVLTEKRCPRCRETKPLSQFTRSRRSPDGLLGMCASCNRKATRRGQTILRYGITPEEVDRLYAKQRGCCAICGEHRPRWGRGGLYVDRNHTTGKVRQLLCARCNVIVGAIESPVAEAARNYVARHADAGQPHGEVHP